MTNFGSTLGLEKRARPRRERPVYSSGPLIRREMTPEERALVETPGIGPKRMAAIVATATRLARMKVEESRR
ncbi:hypothetical protein O0555_21010 [Brevibacillus laterosporus]|nr:hypothetical protein [Brevibacillus laterosporus]MCZ0846420.1 hypothetical protein [Brevibacillus laterosporus]